MRDNNIQPRSFFCSDCQLTLGDWTCTCYDSRTSKKICIHLHALESVMKGKLINNEDIIETFGLDSTLHEFIISNSTGNCIETSLAPYNKSDNNIECNHGTGNYSIGDKVMSDDLIITTVTSSNIGYQEELCNGVVEEQSANK